MADSLIENDQLVDGLRGALRDGQSGLEDVPKMLRLVLAEKAWEKRYDRLSRAEVCFSSFAEFVVARPSHGLGATVDLVRRVVANDPQALDLLDQALQRPPSLHAGDAVDNVHGTTEADRPAGNRAETALRRLRKDRPDLHEQVLAGELSPHKAMVTAGFRRRTATVPVDDPQAAARTIRRQFEHDALVQLVAALIEPEGAT